MNFKSRCSDQSKTRLISWVTQGFRRVFFFLSVSGKADEVPPKPTKARLKSLQKVGRQSNREALVLHAKSVAQGLFVILVVVPG